MSSIYFDNELALNDYASVSCIAWSKGEEMPLLAIADGCVLRIFREGEELVDYTQQRQHVPCTALAWHPTSKVIAAGWEDGLVTFTGPAAVNARDDREVHRESRILSIVFNPNGTRCVTTDNNGVVGVWKTDQRGLCNQMCHYRKSGAHDKVIFRTTTPTGEANLDNPPFFFGGEQGIIYLADDFGLCSERYKIGSPLLLLEYYREKDVVVLVTKSVILVQFSLSADGKVTNESKLKLSCGPTPEKLQGCWAGPGLLATCSHESILRIWNLADDENYILSLQGIDERNSLSGDKVTSVDYNPRKQVLACGTRGGRMVQWRSSTLSGMPKSESNWQVLPVVSVAECAVDKLTWGPGESLIHARTERSSVILSEAQLNSAVQAPLMAVQTSPMEILVYHTERQVHFNLNANYRVKGLAVGPGTIMLWNSKQVTLYDVDVTFQANILASFGRSTEITCAALICQGHDRSIAMASGSKIEITNSQGTTTPGSLPGFYRFDADPAGVLHFVECRKGLCLGNNECQGSNTGALCHGCLAGTTNSGILRKNAQCTTCLPTPVLVIILTIYFLVLYFFVVIIASATIHGMIWKRILSYWQICSAATHVGRLYHTDGVLQLVSDVILYPFHSLIGPDCLFAGTASAETFVFATGVALMPCICTLSTVFFIIKTGIQISINSQKDKRTRGRKELPIKELFIRTFRGATRWNVATLIVLYCPTLVIFMTCCSFVRIDVLRMRYWLEVPLSQAAFFAMFSACAGVIQGLAIPTVLFFILRRLNKRNLLKDPISQSVLGMLYNDFEPEYWWYEMGFFVKKFLFMASTAIPSEVLRIFVFAALSFVHLQSLTLAKPFSAMDGNILQKMEVCFIFSLYSILTAQILLIWFSSGAIEIFAVILVYFAHVLFSVVACRSLLVALVYRPLTLKAMAMPQVMNWLEKLICNSESISRISWDSVRQRLIFTSVNRSGRWKLLETLISELHRYVEKADEFHPSYLSVALDQAFHHCVQQRRDLLIADHPRMLAQERKPGCLGCLIYWFPALLGTSKPAEGIELAKQQRKDRRSLNAVLPLVSTNSASIDEIQEAFIDYAFHEIILQNPDFFQKKDTPAELRYGAPKGVKEQKKRKSNIFLMKQSSAESERLEPQEEVSIEVKPKLAEEQMLAELPLLLAEAEQLQAERDELLKRLEEKEEDIEWLQEIIEQDEAEEVTKPAEAPQVAPISVEQRPELEDVAIDAGGSRLCRC